MENFGITIGQTDARTFAAWMGRNFPSVGFSAVETVGSYEGILEIGVMVTLWETDSATRDDVLDVYGAEHTDEEAFGLFVPPTSELYYNPAHAAAKSANVGEQGLPLTDHFRDGGSL